MIHSIEWDGWKNVFELWKNNNEQLPLKVRRWTWHPDTYAIVTEVIIEKWPYGYVDGYLVLRGIRKDSHTTKRKGSSRCDALSCAGSFQWEIYEP